MWGPSCDTKFLATFLPLLLNAKIENYFLCGYQGQEKGGFISRSCLHYLELWFLSFTLAEEELLVTTTFGEPWSGLCFLLCGSCESMKAKVQIHTIQPVQWVRRLAKMLHYTSLSFLPLLVLDLRILYILIVHWCFKYF